MKNGDWRYFSDEMTALSAKIRNGIWLLSNAVVYSKSARKQSESVFRKENYPMKKAHHTVLLALLLSCREIALF